MSAQATNDDVADAVAAAKAAARVWIETPFEERAAVFLRAADLIPGPYLATVKSASMLVDTKLVQQC